MISELSFKLFGNLTEPHLDYFDTLKTNLKKADMKTPLHEYVCSMLLYSIITFIISITAGSVLITFTILYYILYSYSLAVILSFIFAGVVFFFGYYYPSIKAKDIQTKIDRSLPFSVFYMTTTASSGIDPVEIFRMLSLRGGAIGSEAKRIYNNVKTLGMVLTAAMQKTATRTPSTAFADLLWGMSSIITAGGDLEAYLIEKTKTFMAQYVRTLNDYSKQIYIYTEIYITLIIVGTLFFIILISIVAPLIGVSVLFLQAFLVFFFIPLVSIGFIVLLRTISPMQ